VDFDEVGDERCWQGGEVTTGLCAIARAVRARDLVVMELVVSDHAPAPVVGALNLRYHLQTIRIRKLHPLDLL
jgi:hypothetical protein